MIKFIYHVEASEEAVCPIGFSFFDTERQNYIAINGRVIWHNYFEFEKDYADRYDTLMKIGIFQDLIPKDWNKIKFKQV